MNPDWRDRARCTGHLDRMYLIVFEPLAKATCQQCPVQHHCLLDVLTNEPANDRHGVCAGLTPDERTALADRHKATN